MKICTHCMNHMILFVKDSGFMRFYFYRPEIGPIGLPLCDNVMVHPPMVYTVVFHPLRYMPTIYHEI